MRVLAPALFTFCLAVPADADAPMSAAEFEAYTTGKTLTYSAGGYVYGIEEYLKNRRVRWAFLDDECQEGSWYPAGDMICFEYDGYPGAQCWTFFERPGGLMARYENNPEELELIETRAAREPLICLGPKVGS